MSKHMLRGIERENVLQDVVNKIIPPLVYGKLLSIDEKIDRWQKVGDVFGIDIHCDRENIISFTQQDTLKNVVIYIDCPNDTDIYYWCWNFDSEWEYIFKPYFYDENRERGLLDDQYDDAALIWGHIKTTILSNMKSIMRKFPHNYEQEQDVWISGTLLMKRVKILGIFPSSQNPNINEFQNKRTWIMKIPFIKNNNIAKEIRYLLRTYQLEIWFPHGDPSFDDEILPTVDFELGELSGDEVNENWLSNIENEWKK